MSRSNPIPVQLVLARSVAAGIALAWAMTVTGPTLGGSFVRGDANDSGAVDISDAIRILTFLFSGGQRLNCVDAADTDDSGTLDLSDAVAILQFLFQGVREPRAPYPRCGPDPTEDGLSCEAQEACGPVSIARSNLRVVGAAPHGADPSFVSLDTVRVTIDDPAGGKEVQAGDVIAGEIPEGAPGSELGLAYLRKVDRIVSQTGARKVLQTSPAEIGDAFEKLSLEGEMTFTDPAAGGGGAAGAMGGGGSVHEFNWDDQIQIDRKYEDNYVRGRFTRARGRLSNFLAGFTIGYESGVGLTELSAYSAGDVSASLRFQIAGNWTPGEGGRHCSNFMETYLEESKTIYVHDAGAAEVVPLQVTARILYVAHAMADLNGRVFADFGVDYSSLGVPAFRWQRGALQNASSFTPELLSLDPSTPRVYVDGDATVYFNLSHALEVRTGLLSDGVAVCLTATHMPMFQLNMQGLQEETPGSLWTDTCTRWSAVLGGGSSIMGSVSASGDASLWYQIAYTFGSLDVPIQRGSLSCGSGRTAPQAFLRLDHFLDIPHFPLNFTSHEALFNASNSFDADGGSIREYLWDIDRDGLIDQVTTDPYTTYEYFLREFRCVVYVVDDEGAMGMAQLDYPSAIPR